LGSFLGSFLGSHHRLIDTFAKVSVLRVKA
jgi:hypothetical protein